MIGLSQLAPELRELILIATSRLPQGITDWPNERIASLAWVEGPWTDSEMARITDKQGVIWEVMNDHNDTDDSGFMVRIRWQCLVDPETGDVFATPEYGKLNVMNRNGDASRTIGALFSALGYPDRVRLLTFGPLTPRREGYVLSDPLQNLRPSTAWPSPEVATPI